MATKISYEKNSMRRSHRINIPIELFIEESYHDVINWSLSGIAIKSDKDIFEVNKVYKAILVLKLEKSYVHIEVELKTIYKKGDRYGFKYINLSNKNKKVLRKYIELYIDADLENLASLTSLYEEPELASNIKEPIKFSDVEESSIKRSFLRKSFLSIFFTILIFGGVLTLLYFNFTYLLETSGFVIDNSKKISPLTNGVVDKVYVKVGNKVEKNTILIDLDNKHLLQKLNILEDLKKERLKKNKQKIPIINISLDKKLLKLKKRKLTEFLTIYKNAKIQLKNHLITKEKFLTYELEYKKLKEDYLLYKNRLLQKLQKLKVQLKNKKQVTTKDIDIKILDIKNSLEKYRILASESGKVVELKAKKGDRVNKNANLGLIWIKKVPKIVCILPIHKMSNIKLGTKTIIIDPATKIKYQGTVKEIKNKSLNESSNNLTIYILPDKKAIELSPNKIVNVIFKRSLF